MGSVVCMRDIYTVSEETARKLKLAITELSLNISSRRFTHVEAGCCRAFC